MVVHRHRKRLFGDLLPNHILVERAPDFCRLRHAKVGGLAPGVLVQLFIEDAFANVYATVADIDSGPGDQFAHLGVTLATKRAHGEVGSASHTWSLEKELLSPGLSRQSGLSDFYRPVAGRRGCAVEQLHFLARLNYFVHQTVRLRLLSGHIIIAVRIEPHLFLGFTGVLGDDFDEALLQLEHVIDLTLDVARRPLSAAGNLMDHDIRIRKGEPLALGPRAKQNRSHARSHAKAIGRHIAREKLHGVVNRESSGYGATRRIDIYVDVLFRILHLQKEQLGNDKICNVIVHRRPDENDAILKQPRVDIIAALAPAGLLHNHRNQHRLRSILTGYAHDFSSATVLSSVFSTLTFAFRKSRVLPSRICSVRGLRPSCSSNSLRILSTEIS